jgi:hypothetical protein
VGGLERRVAAPAGHQCLVDVGPEEFPPAAALGGRTEEDSFAAGRVNHPRPGREGPAVQPLDRVPHEPGDVRRGEELTECPPALQVGVGPAGTDISVGGG